MQYPLARWSRSRWVSLTAVYAWRSLIQCHLIRLSVRHATGTCLDRRQEHAEHWPFSIYLHRLFVVCHHGKQAELMSTNSLFAQWRSDDCSLPSPPYQLRLESSPQIITDGEQVLVRRMCLTCITCEPLASASSETIPTKESVPGMSTATRIRASWGRSASTNAESRCCTQTLHYQYFMLPISQSSPPNYVHFPYHCTLSSAPSVLLLRLSFFTNAAILTHSGYTCDFRARHDPW